MSAWRGVALEYLPEMRERILVAPDYDSLWREVTREFRAAMAEGRDEFVTRFFRYAAWTLSPGPQTRTMPQVSQAAAETFYEFADQLNRWIDRYDFMRAQKGLRYYLGDARYAEFEHRFLDQTKRYVKKRKA
jgi:hypothetical protein